MKKIAPLALVLLLAGCLSPREQCLADAARDLTTLRQLIAETEANLSRGFAYETVTVRRPVFTTCKTRKGEEYPCWDEVIDTERKAVGIDLVAERAKLRSMQARERTLARETAQAQATCRAQYPAT